MIRSIRFTLTLWYLIILTLTLCVFGAVLYRTVSAGLYREIDHFLSSEAEGIGEAIFLFWKAERESDLTGKPQLLHTRHEREKEFQSQIAEGKLGAIISRWASATDELQGVRALRLVGRDGQTLAFSLSMAKWALPFHFAPEGSSSKKIIFETFWFEGHRLRLVTRPVITHGQVLYYVQAATSLQQADKSMERLRIWLYGLIPTTGILTSVIGWFLASLALKPVHKMTLQAQKIRESRLHERVDVPKTGDEMEALALTFNEMLSRLERGFKRLRQFSAAASHELRTPLTVMKGELEWALRKPRAEEEYQRALKMQLEVINEMSSIVEQLLAVAHADEGDWAIQERPVNFSNLVRETVLKYQSSASEKKLAITVEGPEAIFVGGEEGLLQRLVSNLIENALKHTPRGGKIKIALGLNNDELVMKIEDTGPGIQEKELSKIFDKFFSRRSSSAGGPYSTGIGLGLCRWIAEAHHGKITAESFPGRGALFTVTLPLIKGD